MPGARSAPRRLLVSLAIGVAVVWMLLAGGLPIVPADLGEVARWAVPLYLAVLVVVHLLRGARWRHLLRPVAHVELRTVVSTAWAGFAAVMFLPVRTGEIVRPMMLARRSEVSGWEAAGTVGAERVIDGLALSSLLALGLGVTTAVDPLPAHVGGLAVPVAAVPATAGAAVGLFAALGLLLGLFYRRHDLGVRLVRATVGRLHHGAAERLAGGLEEVARGLRFLPRAGAFGPFLVETLAYWTLNAAGLWWLAAGCGLEAVGFWEACVVMGCLGLGILAPSAPGYFGTFQLAGYLALAMFVPPATVTAAGAVFVFLAYTGHVVVHATLGLTGLALAPGAISRPADAPRPPEMLARDEPRA